MTYATLPDLTTRFREGELIQLTDPSSTATAIDADVAGKALADADAVIDMYLAGRYTLPLTSVPRVLVNIACDLARAYLYEDRITEQVQKRQDAAMKLLEQLRDGKLQLGLDINGGDSPQPTGGPEFTGGGRVFSRDLLQDY